MPDQQRYHNPDQDCVVEIGNGEKTVTLVCKTDEEVSTPGFDLCNFIDKLLVRDGIRLCHQNTVDAPRLLSHRL